MNKTRQVLLRAKLKWMTDNLHCAEERGTAERQEEAAMVLAIDDWAEKRGAYTQQAKATA